MTAGTRGGAAGLGATGEALPLRRRFWKVVGRALAVVETDAGGWTAMGVAMLASVALSLWLTRGTTFWFDEFTLYSTSHGFDLQVLISPHNGELILLPRLIYATVFALFGANYLVIRVIEAVGVALVGAVTYALARPRIGALALAPATLILFFGFCWASTLAGNGIINVYCVLPGLAAMLVLERGGRWADPLACLLLALSLASWSAGVGFVAGAAVLVLRGADRWRRAWIFALPLVLWALWLVTKPGLSGPLYGSATNAKAANLLLIPNFAADSIAAVSAAVTGLNFDFSQSSPIINGPRVDTSWGPVLAVIAVIAAAFALRSRPIRTWPWAWFTVLAAFWSAVAFVTSTLRTPDIGRYVYVGAAAGLVLAADLVAGFRLTRQLAVLAVAALVFALGANLAHLRDASAYLRDQATHERADLTAIEIARNRVPRSFVPSVGLLTSGFLRRTAQAGTYLDAVDRNGSFADTLPDLRTAPEGAREEADQVLAEALGLHLTPATAPATRSRCQRLTAAASGAVFQLPRGGARIRTALGSAISLRRFGTRYTVELGKTGSRWSALRVPTDLAPDRWRGQVATADPVGVCPL